MKDVNHLFSCFKNDCPPHGSGEGTRVVAINDTLLPKREEDAGGGEALGPQLRSLRPCLEPRHQPLRGRG